MLEAFVLFQAIIFGFEANSETFILIFVKIIAQDCIFISQSSIIQLGLSLKE